MSFPTHARASEPGARGARDVGRGSWLAHTHVGAVDTRVQVGPEAKRRHNQDYFLSVKERREIAAVVSRIRDTSGAHLEQMQADLEFLEERLALGSGATALVSAPAPWYRRWWRRLLSILEQKWLMRYLLVWVTLWEVMTLTAVEWVHYKYGSNLDAPMLAILGAIFALQVAMLGFVLIMSVKLIHKVLLGTVTMSFIIQSYMSTMLLFSGLYLLVFHFDASSFEGTDQSRVHQSEFRTLVYVMDFVTYSTALMSSGVSNVSAVRWSSQLITTIQMLVAMVYWCVILGYGLDHILEYAPPKPLVTQLLAGLLDDEDVMDTMDNIEHLEEGRIAEDAQ